MIPKPSLKLDGKIFSPRSPTKSILKVLAVLEQLPPDELLTTKALLGRCNVARSTVDHAVDVNFSEFSTIVGRVRYWGNPKAIKELLRQVGR
jgi:hypothetical protein